MESMETRRSVLSALGALLVAPLLAPLEALAHGGHDDGDHAPKKDAAQAVAQPGDSGLYRWTDDRGRVHYSQGLGSVPEQFRSSAVPLGARAPSGGKR